jgi:hypothetical protein
MSVPVTIIPEKRSSAFFPPVTDTPAEVKLHGLLDYTILHIVQAYEIVLDSVAGKNIEKTVLVSKWGV